MSNVISKTTSIRWFLLAVALAVSWYMPMSTASASSPDDESTDNQVESTQGDTFTRFEVSKQLLADFAGKLTVSHGDIQNSTDFSGTASEKVSSFLIFPESMGEYEVTLVGNQQHAPVLKVEGILSRSDDGEYTHRLSSAWADPGLFALRPDDPGVVIDIGSVKGYLESCILLERPARFSMHIGVDNDGNGVITDDLETTIMDFPFEGEGCVSTPDVVLPLTSMYRSKVIMTTESTPDTAGESAEVMIIAYNEGVYDFLNKSGVSSEKDASAEIVQEFSVTFVRTPLASSVTIPNSSIRPPEILLMAVPQTREQTADILKQGDRLGTAVPNLVIREDTQSEPGSSLNGENLAADLLRGYWPVLAGLVGLIVVVAISIRNFALAHRHGNQ